MNADNIGRQKINRLAQHCGFGFDTADAPADNPESIDHRGVRVSAHQTVRIIQTMLFPNAFAEEFKIDLMTDAYARRDYAKAVECLHAPLQKLVTRVIAAKLHLHIFREGVAGTGEINLH